MRARSEPQSAPKSRVTTTSVTEFERQVSLTDKAPTGISTGLKLPLIRRGLTESETSVVHTTWAAKTTRSLFVSFWLASRGRQCFRLEEPTVSLGAYSETAARARRGTLNLFFVYHRGLKDQPNTASQFRSSPASTRVKRSFCIDQG